MPSFRIPPPLRHVLRSREHDASSPGFAHAQQQPPITAKDKRLQALLNVSFGALYDWNIETGESLYSKRWKQMFGFADDEIGNTSSEWSSRVHPDDLPKVMLAI